MKAGSKNCILCRKVGMYIPAMKSARGSGSKQLCYKHMYTQAKQ